MKLHQALFWLLILFLPTQLGKHFWPNFAFISGIRTDYLSPTIYLTDILIVGILGLWGFEKVKRKRLKVLVFPAAIFFFLLLNSLLAQNPGAALYKFVKIVEFSLLGLYIAKNRISLSIIYHPLSIAVIYSSLIAIAQFLKQSSLGGIFWWLGERSFSAGTPGISLGEFSGRLFLRPYGTFSHPNSMAGFTLIALILLFGNFKSTNQPINKLKKYWIIGIYWKLVFILGLLVLVLSFSRAVWLVGALVGLWWMIRRRFSMLFVVCCLLFLVFLGLSFPRMSEEPVQERLQLIKVAILMIKNNPLSGAGLNNFIVQLPKFWQVKTTYFLQPVHNFFLLIAAETGLVGLVIFLWFLCLTFKKLLEIGNWRLVIPLLAILLTGVADHYWFTLQQNQLLLTILLGICWSEKL